MLITLYVVLVLVLLLIMWIAVLTKDRAKLRKEIAAMESKLSVAENKNKEYLLAFQQIEFAEHVGFRAAGIHLTESVHR
jgi:cell division protein FtsL